MRSENTPGRRMECSREEINGTLLAGEWSIPDRRRGQYMQENVTLYRGLRTTPGRRMEPSGQQKGTL